MSLRENLRARLNAFSMSGIARARAALPTTMVGFVVIALWLRSRNATRLRFFSLSSASSQSEVPRRRRTDEIRPLIPS
jgi:hypothetical protein